MSDPGIQLIREHLRFGHVLHGANTCPGCLAEEALSQVEQRVGELEDVLADVSMERDMADSAYKDLSAEFGALEAALSAMERHTDGPEG